MDYRNLFLLAMICLAVFAPGCGCNRTEERTLTSGPSAARVPGVPTGKPQGEAEDGTSRGLSIAEAAFIRSPEEGFGRKKKGTGVAPTVNTPLRGEFDRKYTKGVELMENGSYTAAMQTFEEILNQYPDSEEASVAEYCIAEIHFRNKSNQLALQAFQHIVEKYPNSPAAQNAKEGIEYLQTFEEHEKEYVSPEVEDRKRRGF